LNHQRLKRELGLGGAIVTGLGSILGTGAFVSIGLASSRWGDVLLVAIPAAAVVAVFSGLSSAYLAGRFPVAGGTYEYAYETLGPLPGFTAGWLFLLAKTASAASAALGIAFYLSVGNTRVFALAAIGLATILVASGLRRTTVINIILVTVTLVGLLAFSFAGFSSANAGWLAVGVTSDGSGVLAAIAFLFVAYTGYGRVATLGEEVKEPARTIPRAVIVTLLAAAFLYMAVELGGRALGGANWGSLLVLEGFTPASLLDNPYRSIVTVGAVTAMVGVLLNLILGLSRVWLAMGRRGDMPTRLSHLDGRTQPLSAVLLSGATVALVSLVGDIRLAWSFSAFTVLLYYGITNLAAIRLDKQRWTAWAGLVSCVLLSFFVTIQVWLVGTGLVLLGMIWHRLRRK